MIPGKLRVLDRHETFLIREVPAAGLIGELFAKPAMPVTAPPGAVVCYCHESREHRVASGLDGEPFPVRCRSKEHV
jgi:hypothetical protein